MSTARGKEDAVVHVLVVEDDPVQSDILREYLELQPDIHWCGRAAEGAEGLRMLEELHPDVVVLDMVMPNMDGADFLREIQALPRAQRPYIIVLSAFGHEQVAHEALQLGADRFLMKPYRIELLARGIRNAMQGPGEDGHEKIVRRVTQKVFGLGARTNGVGYHYFKMALQKMLESQTPCSLSKDVYSSIAKENGTSAQCVEKALRKTIKGIFEANTEELQQLLQESSAKDKSHMSNGRFLTLVVESMRMEEAREAMREETACAVT